jgi:hypothetical protein
LDGIGQDEGQTMAKAGGQEYGEGEGQGDGERAAQRRGGTTMEMRAGRSGRYDADVHKKSFRIEIWHFIVELRSLYSQIERFIVGSTALKRLISWGYFPSLGVCRGKNPFMPA